MTKQDVLETKNLKVDLLRELIKCIQNGDREGAEAALDDIAVANLMLKIHDDYQPKNVKELQRMRDYFFKALKRSSNNLK